MTQELQNQINSAIRYHDEYDAIKAIVNLQVAGELDLSNSDIIKLHYIRINSLSADQLYNVLKASMLTAYKIEDYKLSERVKEYFVQYNFIPDEVELCKKISKLMETSEEVLGVKDINLLGRQALPTIGHWVQDHASHLGTRKRDALALMQYINNSANVKSLNSAERLVLKDILELYDYCESTVDLWNQLPEKVDDRELDKLQSAFDWSGVVLGLEPETAEPIQKPTAPLSEFDAARPTPSPTLNENKHEPQPKSQSQPSPANVATPSAQANRTVNIPNQYSTNPAKIHDLINKKPKMGVVLDPTNVKLEEEKRRLNQDRNDQADMIQFKLAELRKRNKSDDNETK